MNKNFHRNSHMIYTVLDQRPKAMIYFENDTMHLFLPTNRIGFGTKPPYTAS